MKNFSNPVGCEPILLSERHRWVGLFLARGKPLAGPDLCLGARQRSLVDGARRESHRLTVHCHCRLARPSIAIADGHRAGMARRRSGDGAVTARLKILDHRRHRHEVLDDDVARIDLDREPSLEHFVSVSAMIEYLQARGDCTIT